MLVLLLIGATAACTKTDATDPSAPGQNARQLGSDKPIRLESGTITVKQDEDVSIVRAADEALAGKEVDQETLLRLARRAERAGQPAFASGFYSRALQNDPENAALLKKLGFALFEAGRLKRAQTVFERALAVAPKDPEVLRGIGNVQVSWGNPQAAIDTYRRALGQDSGRSPDHRIYNGLGVALDMTGDHEGARQAYRLGLARAPSNASLRNNLALSLAASGRYAAALRILRKLVAEDGGNPKHRRNLRRVRQMAAKAGVAVPKRPQTSERRERAEPSEPGAAIARRPSDASTARAEPARRPAMRDRSAGRPRRLVPGGPPRSENRVRRTASRSVPERAEPDGAEGRRSAPAADLARLAPAGGDPDRVEDDAGVGADRAFLRTWNGRVPRSAQRRLVRITPHARSRAVQPSPEKRRATKPESAPVE